MDGLYPIRLHEISAYPHYGVETFKLFWRFDEDRILELKGNDRVFSSGIVRRETPSRSGMWQVHITQSPLKAVKKPNWAYGCPYAPSALVRLEAVDEPQVQVLEFEYRSRRYHMKTHENYSGVIKRNNSITTRFNFRPCPEERRRENMYFELTVVVGYARTAMYGNSTGTIRALRESKVRTDAMLVSRDGCGIPVHRVIISAQSQFFYAALSGAASNNPSEKIKIIMDVDSCVLNVFVRVIYGARLDELPTEMLQSIYVVAGEYGPEGIVQQAKSTLLKRNLKVEELVSFYIFAKRHGEKELGTKALKSVVAHREKFFMNGGLDGIDGSDKDVFEESTEDFTNDVRLSSIFKEFSEAELFSTGKSYENFKDPLHPHYMNNATAQFYGRRGQYVRF